MDATLVVVAIEGCTCPRENPRESHITDTEPVTVPNNIFYRRLIADGSLRLADTVVPSVDSTKSKKTSGGGK